MNQNWNNNKISKEHHACRKDYICYPAAFSCEIGKYLARTIEDSVNMCDEIVNAVESVSTNPSTNVTSTASIDFCNKKVRHKMVYFAHGLISLSATTDLSSLCVEYDKISLLSNHFCIGLLQNYLP